MSIALERTCVMEGCSEPAAGHPVVLDGVQAFVCRQHRQTFQAEPLAFDGEFNVAATEVLRMWHR
jgi:hypothetical protein